MYGRLMKKELQKIYFYTSESSDPKTNLSIEEYFYRHTDYADHSFVLVYKNDSSVIGGKNQNPWKEANLPYLQKYDIPYIRRISGGGCVYHDKGNINFSFIGPKDSYNQMQNLGFLQQALSGIGIDSEITKRGDILVNSKKVSGNAMAFSKDRYLHHFTLLIDSDLKHLRNTLKAEQNEYSGAAVDSNPMSVMNLSDHSKDINEGSILSSFLESLSCEYTIIDWEQRPVPDAFVEKYSADDWNFEKTPAFSVKSPFLTEIVRFILDVHKGLLREIKTDDLAYTGGNLNIRFSYNALKSGIPGNVPERSLLLEWLKTFVH